MSNSIIPLLVKKDLLINRKMILICFGLSLLSIVIVSMLFGRVPNWAFVNLAFILLFAPGLACGMVLLFKTIVMEKVKATQPFILSLPLSVKEFTLAKLLTNLPTFTVLWLLACSVAFYFAFVRGAFPYGTLPFVIMIFVAVFAVYICILCISLLFQSHGATVLAITFFELISSAYLWTIAYLEPIANYIYGPVSVWNSTAVSIVVIQVLVIVIAIFMTIYLQNKKRDFI